jgi:hypothetical protein
VRPVPRPQVRSDHAARLLRAPRLLQPRARVGHRRRFAEQDPRGESRARVRERRAARRAGSTSSCATSGRG